MNTQVATHFHKRTTPEKTTKAPKVRGKITKARKFLAVKKNASHSKDAECTKDSFHHLQEVKVPAGKNTFRFWKPLRAPHEMAQDQKMNGNRL